MKLIAIILDGNGQIIVAGSRAPDLLRREIAKANGGAELLHCQMPVKGVAMKTLLARLEQELKGAPGLNMLPSLPATPALIKAVRRAVFRVIVVEPAILKAKNDITRFTRRTVFTCWFGKRSTLAH